MVIELPSAELVEDETDRPTAVMAAAVRTALLAGARDPDDVDTGVYTRTNEVDRLLAMVDASEASGSIIIEFDCA